MINRGKRGHPGRFFAGTNWERQLHAYGWQRGERVWENEAQDRLKWKPGEDDWVAWRMSKQFVRGMKRDRTGDSGSETGTEEEASDEVM